jgi:hypothetical protein
VMPLTESGAFGIWCGQSSCHVHRYQRSCVRLQGCHLLWTQVAASPIEAGHRHPIGDLRRVERLHARPGPNLAPSPAPAYPLPTRRTRRAKIMLTLPRNIQALACCAGACLQSSFCTWGNFNRRKWGFFNRRKLGNIQPALTPRRTVGSYNGRVQPWKAGLSTPFS